MIEYDASVIVTFAEKLYEQAQHVVVTTTIVGVLAGVAIGIAFDSAFGTLPLAVVVAAAAGGVLAFNIGQQKAFSLRLQAQIALCQVWIESNTRASRRAS